MPMKWVLRTVDQERSARLAGELGIHPVIASLLVGRGLVEAPEARMFLSCGLDGLTDPAVFLDMDTAAARIRKALLGKERIVVYGDYDSDGVTGSAVLFLALKRLGADVRCYIPDRAAEGYGLNTGALERIAAEGAGLVVTVDCGISAHREAERARALGFGLIITDHHELPRSGDAALPWAEAVLHPSRLRDGTPDRIREHVGGMTGVGMVFKLVQALVDDGAFLESLLDLVTIGTVADVGKLTGENRIMVRHGLGLLSRPLPEARIGLAALRRAAGLDGKQVTAGTVGFSIAPRINASGRMNNAVSAFRLLTTGSPEEAEELARSLDAVNRDRQTVEERILREARDRCAAYDIGSLGALVLDSTEWHPGVIGIVAARLVEEYYRPAALVVVKDGTGKGSARSIPGFDLYEGLSACSDLLLGYGGHKYAAGFTLQADRIPAFRDRLDALVRERLGPEGFIRTLTIDAALPLDDLSVGFMKDLELLEPHGMGNPEPRFGAKGLNVVSARVVGRSHLKMRLRQGDSPPMDAIAFGKAELLGTTFKEGSVIAAVFTPKVSTWGGATKVELEIKDVKREK